jgi:radical SAM superfamily enzyme YgiQ (UPF0313 family)
MRVLLINAQADFSFWTLSTACRLSGTKALAPPLGLITMAALLPTEWELLLVDLNAEQLTEDHWNWSDTIMISGMLGQRTSLLALIPEAKRRGKTIVAGGPYPTAIVDELLDAGVDFVVRGEAENTVPILVEALYGGTKGRIIENPEKPDLSSSPIPRYDLLRLKNYQFLLVQTSRGCPFECEFCDVISLFGRQMRHKQSEQVFEELERLYRLGWRKSVFIADDNFIGSKKRAKAILEELIQWQQSRGQPFGFQCQASMDLAQDMELIDLMTAANFGNVFMGIETSDTDVLKQSKKLQNVRHPLAEAVSTINKNGLSVQGSFIVGFDGEKKGADERLCGLAEEASIPVVMINLLVAPPGTQLWDRMEREGRLKKEVVVGDYLTGDKMNFIPERPEQEIFREYAHTWDYLYEPSRFLARVYRYYLNMRPTRAATAKNNGARLPRTKRAKPPLRDKFNTAKGFILLAWRQGIRPPHRFHWWKQLFGLWRQNPSRISPYVICCAMGEDLFRIRETLLNSPRLEEQKPGVKAKE